MKEIIITTQKEFDALPARFDEYTKVIIKNTSVRMILTERENSSVVAWGNSSVEARGNSSVEAWGNSSVVARENSSVVARENSSVEAWGNSSVEAWGNSSVEARENTILRVLSRYAKIVLFGCSLAYLTFPKSEMVVKIAVKSKTAIVHCVKPTTNWFEINGIQITVRTKNIILYKRVSADFKTQEETVNETLWIVGTTLTHPKWNPTAEECGRGKFHACSRPYFCDEFRSVKSDKYIALKVPLTDTYAWPNPQYQHKIAFKTAKVLYVCDKFGKEIK